MKRLYFFLITIFVFAYANANPIDSLTAKTVAENFYALNSDKTIQNITLGYTDYADDGTPAYYVFNINENDGWVMVCADDSSTPILGYNITGNFTGKNMPPQFKYWKDNYINQIRKIQIKKIQPTIEIKNYWVKLKSSKPNKIYSILKSAGPPTLPIVGPLLGNIQWHQFYPYNQSCPGYSFPGCPSIAMGQIMKYWHWPNKGKGTIGGYTSSVSGYTYTIPSFILSNYSINWDNIPAQTTIYTKDLSDIIYYIGISVYTNYSPNESGIPMTSQGINNVLNSYTNNFYYNPSTIQVKTYDQTTTIDQWNSMLRNEINNDRPIQYFGQINKVAHTWVCDGYDGNNLFHMNWGWKSPEDYIGYYSTLASSTYSIYYPINQKVIIGIQPTCQTADLQFASMPTVSNSTPTTGSKVNVYCQEYNGGSTYAGSNVVKVYISSSETLYNNYTELGTISFSGLSQGATSSTGTAQITIPSTITPGTYYLHFWADANQTIGECIENNNFAHIQINVTSSTNTCPTPSNDNASGAISITENASAINGISCGATGDASYSTCTNLYADDDVFYKFTATTSTVTVNVSPTSGTDYNPAFQLLSGSSLNNLQSVSPDCINNYGAGQTESQKYTNLITGNTYYIRVWHATTGYGSYGTFNISASGSSSCTQPAKAINLTPGTSSVPGETINTTTPTLNWNTSSGATTYEVNISKSPYGSANIIYTKTCVNPPFSVPSGILQSGVDYRWDVSAYTSCNSDCYTISDKSYFTVNTNTGVKPSLPQNTYPGTTNSPGTMLSGSSNQGLYWTEPATGTKPIKYHVIVTDVSTNSPVFNQPDITFTGYVMPSLQPGKSYHWTVQASNSAGTSDWTTALYFQTPQTCSYSISPATVIPASSYGTGTISVTANTGCSWTAVSNNTGWLTVSSGSSGSGNGTVSYAYSENTSSSTRTGTITVAGKTFTVTQAGKTTPSPGAFTLSLTPECNETTTQIRLNWTVSSNATSYDIFRNGSLLLNVAVSPQEFIDNSVVAGSSYNYYVIAKNNTGSVFNSNSTLSATALNCSPTCSYSISPATVTPASSSGTGTISVTANTGCPWTAVSNNTGWLTVSSGSSGSGNGTVSYAYSENTSSSTRTGTITVAGKTFTVTQAGKTTPTNYDLRLYSNLNIPTTKIPFGDPFSLTVSIANYGTGSFSGQFAAYIVDSENKYVDHITTNSQTLSGGNYNTFTFTLPGSTVLVPGKYSVAVYFYEATSQSYVIVANGNYTNWKQFEIFYSSDIEVNSPFTITTNGGKLIQGELATVNVNVLNTGSSTFYGKFSVILINLDGIMAQTIDILDASNGLPANDHYTNGLNFSGNITVPPGTYLLTVAYQPSGDINWYYAGSTNYSNPVYITVVSSGIQPDIYEVNNTQSQAYNLPVTFSGDSVNVNSNGSTLHNASDIDYYKIVLPPSYNYVITPRLHDSYNSGNGQTYTADAQFSLSLDNTNLWSSVYDDVMGSNININNGGTLYFKVDPYSSAATGTYLLDLIIFRSATTSIDDIDADTQISLYPNPAKNFVTIDIRNVAVSVDKIELVDLQGRNCCNLNEISSKELINFPLTDIPKGVYFLKIYSNRGVLAKKLIVDK